jgi:hypothetical protein
MSPKLKLQFDYSPVLSYDTDSLIERRLEDRFYAGNVEISFVGIKYVSQITVLLPWKTDYQPDMIGNC